MRGETYRETAREVARAPTCAARIADAGGSCASRCETVPALIDMKAGSYYVPLDQPLANLVVAALEPDTQNSFFANRIVSELGQVARVMAKPAASLQPLP